MEDIICYSILNFNFTPWFYRLDDAIDYLEEETESGTRNVIIELSTKYNDDSESIGDIALTSVIEYVTQGVVG